MRQITEVKRTLTGRIERWKLDVCSRTDHELVALFTLPKARDVHFVRLPAGTTTVGYFWKSRPYNLYHWVHPAHGTLAYYFNIGDVRTWGEDEFEWDDLAIDVLASPDGRVEVLDEDELPASLDPDRLAHIFAARDEVLRSLPALIETAEERSTLVLRGLV